MTPPTPVDLAVDPTSQTVEVNSVPQFAALLGHWHKNQIKYLGHLANIPEGTPISIDEAPDVPLTGDLLAGFKAGIVVAMNAFEKLPFVYEMESTPEAPATEPAPEQTPA